MKRRALLLGLGAAGLTAAVGCATTDDGAGAGAREAAPASTATSASNGTPRDADGDGKAAPAVRPTTVVPEAFGRRLAPAENAFVPEGAVAISEVVRPRAEVRTGPGTQFDLTDVVLPQGAKVIVFQKVGVWRHVLAPPRWQRGWVHHRALSEAEPNRRPAAVDLGKLPTVLALRPVAVAAAFPGKEPVPVAIPKGAMF